MEVNALVTTALQKISGQFIRVHASQSTGRVLNMHVLSYQNGVLLINPNLSQGNIASLVNRQKLLIELPLPQETVTVQAIFRRSNGMNCRLDVGPKPIIVNQRQCRRMDARLSVKLASLPQQSSARMELSTLKWLSTESKDISSGGMMLQLPVRLPSEVLMLIHVQNDSVNIPPLLLARVRHAYQVDAELVHTGVEFLTAEQIANVVPHDRRRQLPRNVLKFTAEKRNDIEKSLLRLSKQTNNQFIGA